MNKCKHCSRPIVFLLDVDNTLLDNDGAQADLRRHLTGNVGRKRAKKYQKRKVVLIASGSEVIFAVEAHERLLADGIRSRVVSMPSWDIFEHQTQEYQDSVLPPSLVARIAVEQASTFGWERYIGKRGRMIGIKTFGVSAPLKELQRKFGFTPDSIVTAAKEQVPKVGEQCVSL